MMFPVGTESESISSATDRVVKVVICVVTRVKILRRRKGADSVASVLPPLPVSVPQHADF